MRCVLKLLTHPSGHDKESWGTENPLEELCSKFLAVESYFGKIKPLLMSPRGVRSVYRIPITHGDYEQFGDLFSYVKVIKISEIFGR